MLFVGSPFFILLALVVIIHMIIRRRFKGRLWYKIVLFNLLFILFFASFLDTTAVFFSDRKINQFRVKSFFCHHGLEVNTHTKTFWGETDVDRYDIYTNSLGFIDESSRDISLKTDAKRLLFMGDSFTEGVGYPWPTTFVGKISKTLKKQGIEVLNAGVVSYSPKLHYLRLKKLLLNGLQVDRIMLLLDISDMQDEVVYKYFVPAKVGESLFLYRMNTFFIRHSFLYHSYYKQIYLANKNPLDPEKSPFWKSHKRFHRLTPQWIYNDKEFDRWGREGLASADSYLKKIAELCEQHNIAFSMVIYPWPNELKRKELDDRHHRYWTKFSQDNNIELIDMFPLFFNLGESSPDYFIEGDVHWTPQGHQLVYDYLIKHIQKEYYHEK